MSIFTLVDFFSILKIHFQYKIQICINDHIGIPYSNTIFWYFYQISKEERPKEEKLGNKKFYGKKLSSYGHGSSASFGGRVAVGQQLGVGKGDWRGKLIPTLLPEGCFPPLGSHIFTLVVTNSSWLGYTYPLLDSGMVRKIPWNFSLRIYDRIVFQNLFTKNWRKEGERKWND